MAMAHFPWQEMAYIQHDKCWFHVSAVPASIGGHLRLLHSAKGKGSSPKYLQRQPWCGFLTCCRLNEVLISSHHIAGHDLALHWYYLLFIFLLGLKWIKNIHEYAYRIWGPLRVPPDPFWEAQEEVYGARTHQDEACEWSQSGALSPLGFLEQVLHTAETRLWSAPKLIKRQRASHWRLKWTGWRSGRRVKS